MDAYLALLGKDLRVELRTLRSLPAMALFAVTTFVLFRFALDRTELEGGLAAGVVLVTVLFAVPWRPALAGSAARILRARPRGARPLPRPRDRHRRRRFFCRFRRTGARGSVRLRAHERAWAARSPD